MRLYASDETIPLIARSVGWSEGRVRKVLREVGVVLTEKGEALKRRVSEEATRRLLAAGWETRMRGGLDVASAGRARKLVLTGGGVRDGGER